MDGVPFGAGELLDAVRGRHAVLDAGCGSGRLTVALARAGHEATGLDVSASAIAASARRAQEAGVRLRLVEGDVSGTLPFAGGSFDAATSRLVLMIPADPTAALAELARCLRPGSPVATAVWATVDENPWFCEPRAAVAEALGADRAAFARVFGRLGAPEELAAVHRDAGLVDVEAYRLAEPVGAADYEAHWQTLAAENGHYRRLDASLATEERERLLAVLERRLAPFADGDGALTLPRALILATAHVRR